MIFDKWIKSQREHSQPDSPESSYPLPDNIEPLKRCPFCGAYAEVIKIKDKTIFETYRVQCKNCDSRTRERIEVKDAVCNWNRRKDTQLQDIKLHEERGYQLAKRQMAYQILDMVGIGKQQLLKILLSEYKDDNEYSEAHKRLNAVYYEPIERNDS